MPVTHEYPRFAADARFGLTVSPRCNLLVVSDPVTRHRPQIVAGAAEDAIVWNPVTGQAVRKFREEDDPEFADDEGRPRLRAGAVAVRLAWHAGSSALAIGYSDGWVRLYNLWTGELLVKLCGHKHAITCLAFDQQGAMLATGGQDSDVTLLRVEGESGFRLQGHTNAVTQVHFPDIWPNCLISSSKDGLVKFWNLELRVCFKTLTGHPGEVWDFALIGEARDLMVTGSCDNQLRLWRLSVSQEAAPPPDPKRQLRESQQQQQQQQAADLEEALTAEFLGCVPKATKGRTHSLAAAASGRLLCVASGGRGLEWFACPPPQQLRTRLRQRQKKAARKGDGVSAGGAEARAAVRLLAEDLLRPAGRITGLPAKLRWAASTGEATVSDDKDNSGNDALTFDCFASLSDNSVVSYRLRFSSGAVSVAGAAWPRLCQGHEGPLRWAAVSSDGLAVMTLSSGLLKLWHYASLGCLLTVPCPDSKAGGQADAGDVDAPAAGGGGGGGGLTRCQFLPGDRYAAAGTADGRLLLCDLSDGRVVEQLQAHSGPLNCLVSLSDRSGLVTGSSQEAKALQWRYEIARPAESGGLGSRLSLLLARAISLTDSVAAACQTPDSRLLCFSLMDNSVRVLFADSVRQFLHLHGHSQPALALAASQDSALLASGSGDRTIRLWGLQFGDCQRVLRGHELAVTGLAFLPGPQGQRLLVSAGSDKCLRLWDAAKFRRVAALHGHQAGVSCVVASPGGGGGDGGGGFLASVDQDGSVRTWRRCEEPLVLEEQQELEKEAQFEEELAEQQAEGAEAGAAVSGLVARMSLQSVRGAEGLLAALERWESERDHAAGSTAASSAGQPPPAARSLESLASWLGRQPLHELEQAVAALPSVHARRLFTALTALGDGGLQPERVCRCACLLLSFHFPSLAAASGNAEAAAKFQGQLAACGSGLADLLGFNLAALRLLQGMLAGQERQPEDALVAATTPGQKRKQMKKRQKRVFELRTC